MRQELTYEYISDFVNGSEGKGCTLITTKGEFEQERINKTASSAIWLKISCRCCNHNTFSVTFNKFKNYNKRQCSICSIDNRTWRKRLTVDELNERINSYSQQINLKLRWKFINGYVNKDTKNLEITDEYGYKYLTDYRHVEHNSKNSYYPLRFSVSNPFSIDNIKTFILINVEGYEYVSGTYTKSSNCKLNFKCPKDHIYESRWMDFQSGYRCPICNQSHGETKIARLLINHNIIFDTQYKVQECKYKYPLPFDFAIFADKERAVLKYLIEYDGELHYKEIKHFGGQEKLQRRQENDQIKNKYCHTNNINLIRIPYWDFDNIEEIFIKHGIINAIIKEE